MKSTFTSLLIILAGVLTYSLPLAGHSGTHGRHDTRAYSVLESLDIYEDGALDHAKRIYMTTHGLMEPSHEIHQIAQEALAYSDITSPVIVLEDPHVDNPDGSVIEFPGYAFLVLKSLTQGTALERNSRIFAAYHECGHVYYHHSPQRQKTSLSLLWPYLSRLLSVFNFRSPYRTYALPAAYSQAYAAHTALNWLLTSKFCQQLIAKGQRAREKEADLFACQQLAQAGRNEIIEQELYTLRVEDDEHPSNAERSQYIGEFLEQL